MYIKQYEIKRPCCCVRFEIMAFNFLTSGPGSFELANTPGEAFQLHILILNLIQLHNPVDPVLSKNVKKKQNLEVKISNRVQESPSEYLTAFSWGVVSVVMYVTRSMLNITKEARLIRNKTSLWREPINGC